MSRFFFVAGSISGSVAVAAGAFAAHLLEPRLDPRWVEVFRTGADYQMVHALALLAAAWAAETYSPRPARAAGWCFLAGTLLFSGSLYLLVLTQSSWLGAVTPFGGVSFLAGWGLLALAAMSRPGRGSSAKRRD